MVGLTMPPRSSLTSSFSVSDTNNEVVCPLRNQDGSSCRKRCLGEKRYRSMQEHIRRAHPEHYIPKLPATEESFQLMINTPPSERPPPPRSSNPLTPHGFTNDHPYYRDDSSAPNTPKQRDEYQPTSLLPAASAAAALAQLHAHKIESDWESENDWASDSEAHSKALRSIELPPIHPSRKDFTSEPFPPFNARAAREVLPSILSTSPPGRSSTLPPIQRHPNRPRKQSLSKRAREPQHKRHRSKEQVHFRRMSHDRKALSAEPSGPYSVYGKRWEDLIDAATSATEDADEDRTPVPPSPLSVNRASLPPFPTGNQFQSYQASPLQQALTPPSYAQDAPVPFPSVESGESADNFHVDARGPAGSSPTFSAQGICIYCAACQGVSPLKESYACTECICGLCQACVDVLMAEQGARRKCPRCATIGGRFKPFQLDIR